ncbi:MAG: hypothetical protein ABIR06_08015 [Cyclobacteriaceae bacterium]
MSKYEVQTVSNKNEEISRALRLSNEQLKQVENSSSGQFGVTIPIAKLVLGASASSNSSSKQLDILRSSFQSDETRRLTDDESNWLFSTALNDDVPSAFVECMKMCLDAGKEFRIQTIGDVEKDFIIIVSYSTARKGRPSSIAFSNPSVTNVKKIDADNILAGATLTNGASVSQAFRRTSNSVAFIVINFQDEPALSVTLSTFDNSQNSKPEVNIPKSIPIFTWYEFPTHQSNSLSITARSGCDGCGPASNTSQNWPSAIAVASTGFSACNLPASSEAKVSVTSFKDPADKTTGIRITGTLKSFAGWGGKPDGASPYRPSQSGITVTGVSGIDVAASSGYCLMVTKFDMQGSRAKAYPGSHLFGSQIYPDWPNPIAGLISFETPTGETKNLIPASSIPLNQAGIWKIKLNGVLDFDSIWSENSGTVNFEQELRVKVVRMYADGSCP